MNATIAAGAKLQFESGQWVTLKTEQTAEVISERFGIYKIILGGKRFSVDYKHVTLQS
jgi:hypothetical protein